MPIKYKWVAERLEMMIEKNIRKGIRKLPTELELGRRYQVSRQTIRMALSLLEEKGLLSSRQGSGYYITDQAFRRQGNILGVLISSDREYIYPSVLNAVRTILSENGFSMQVFPTGNCVSTEREILLALLKAPLPAILVEGCKSALPNPNLDLYRQLMKKGCQPVFLFNYYPDLPGCLSIKDDNYNGSALLVRYLASQGHTAIGGIFKADDMQGTERYQGYIETMRDLSLPRADSRVFWYGSRELDKLLSSKDTLFLRDIVKEIRSSCTAVLCYNDLIAYYLVEELLRAGCRVPEDMAVVAFDNTYLSDSDILTITTLSHEPHEIGTKAAKAVIRKLNGLPVSSQEIRWNLNPKESTQTDLLNRLLGRA